MRQRYMNWIWNVCKGVVLLPDRKKRRMNREEVSRYSDTSFGEDRKEELAEIAKPAKAAIPSTAAQQN